MTLPSLEMRLPHTYQALLRGRKFSKWLTTIEQRGRELSLYRARSKWTPKIIIKYIDKGLEILEKQLNSRLKAALLKNLGLEYMVEYIDKESF